MRPPVFRLISISAALMMAVMTLATGGCARQPLPASPVAAPLSDLQAIELASLRLQRDVGIRPSRVHWARPTGDGHLVAFHSAFDAAARPPVASRIVQVRHDGSTQLLEFHRDE